MRPTNCRLRRIISVTFRISPLLHFSDLDLFGIRPTMADRVFELGNFSAVLRDGSDGLVEGTGDDKEALLRCASFVLRYEKSACGKMSKDDPWKASFLTGAPKTAV